jgi:ABC-type transport system involved in cytochrome c biogenesis permease component
MNARRFLAAVLVAAASGAQARDAVLHLPVSAPVVHAMASYRAARIDHATGRAFALLGHPAAVVAVSPERASS